MKNEEVLNLVYVKLNDISKIPSHDWLVIKEKVTIRSFKKGDFLFRSGDTKLFIGFLLSGLLHSFYLKSDGKQFTKNFIWENRILGPWTSILQKKASSFNLQALEDSNAVIIQSEDFLDLQKKFSSWAMLSKICTENLLIEREIREHDFLMLSNKQRYFEFLNHFNQIVPRIPQHLIASYLGISPVSLSRILNN